MNKNVKKGLAVALGVVVIAVGVSGLRLKDIEELYSEIEKNKTANS